MLASFLSFSPCFALLDGKGETPFVFFFGGILVSSLEIRYLGRSTPSHDLVSAATQCTAGCAVRPACYLVWAACFFFLRGTMADRAGQERMYAGVGYVCLCACVM